MKVSGATPLVALNAVAVDTETTGLDPVVARIVEIGAVRLSRGVVLREQTMQRLVDPRVAIPASATAIHGIGEADLRGAPSFPAAWDEFCRFAGTHVLIGHSIGFDLAVLERECARAHLPWRKPRTLCVRLLASIAHPHLPDHSFEAIAGWLGVAVEGRHRALGDATAAADIFTALVPKLSQRGIRTLAEAERACLDLTEQLERHHRAGWSEPVLRPPAGTQRMLGSVDPFAHARRVRDVMTAPPVVVPSATTLGALVARMTERRIGSVVVSEAGDAGGAVDGYGILTERDVMRLVATHGAAALDYAVGPLASRPLESIRDAAFVYRAIGRMDRLGIRHLAVRDERGRLTGIVSARDLLRLRAAAAISLDDAIEAAGNAADMAAAWATLPAVAGALVAEGIEARTVAGIVSEELCSATRRAARLAEAQMLAQGLGAPPCPYALMVLGSGGRGESLLAADQDNAIVYAEGAPDGLEDRWFATLGEILSSILDTAGIPFCKGGVMARNPSWRGSTEAWMRRIGEWIGRSRPEDLLNVDIFFDLLPVHGEAALAHALFDRAYDLGGESSTFAKRLGERLGARTSPFTLLGGFRTEDGRIDLKMHGLFPVVSLARTLSIRHGVRERSTFGRLTGLSALGIGGEADVARLKRAHGLFMRLMLARQSADLLAGIPVSTRVDVAALSADDQAELKSALKAAQLVPELARSLMFGPG